MTTVELKKETLSAADPQEPRRQKARWLPWLLLAVALGLFVYGVQTIPNSVPSQFGLLAVASPAYGISILLVVIGFALGIRQGNIQSASAAVLLLIVTFRLPRSISTDMPMYAWSYKHLGVVDYIQDTHRLARDVDIYNGWPGLFGLTAWFSELSGIPAESIAHWFTPLYHILFAALVYCAARAWDLDPLRAVTAVFLVELLNWVEQDYFSPQALTTLLFAGIVTIAGLSRERPVAVWLLLLLFAAATVTHQLTPYSILIMIGLLAFTRRLKPWWILFPLGAIAGAYLLYNWDSASQFSLFSSDVTQNVKSPIPAVGVLGQRITSGGIRALSVTMWLGAAVILIVQWRRNQNSFAESWTLGVLALGPTLVVFVQSYGGEVIFRIFLYSLIGCSIVIAPVVVGAFQARLRTFVLGATGLILAGATSVQGSTGAWYANIMPKVQVDTSRIVLAQAELPAYLTSVAPVWPERSSSRYVDYARFNKNFDALMIQADSLTGLHFDNDDDYASVVRALYGRPDASTYLIMTEQMQVYAWYYGILPWDALPNLKEYLKRDTERWEPFYDGQGITVFRHKVDTTQLGGG